MLEDWSRNDRSAHNIIQITINPVITKLFDLLWHYFFDKIFIKKKNKKK